MNKLVRQHFRVENYDELRAFYCELLGMKEFNHQEETRIFGYREESCCLVFHKQVVSQYMPEPNDAYWKIGITLRDLDLAVEYLRDHKYEVPNPHQFRDIGYLTSITDPYGFKIELLQQDFQGHAQSVSDGHPIGAQAILAHITLRITDLGAAQNYFEEKLGMRLMSVQPVSEYGFCLYFYTWSNEELPQPDLKSVENREWLWARPYTFIELQHLEGPGISINKTPATMAGFDGFSYSDHGDLKLITSEVLKHLK